MWALWGVCGVASEHATTAVVTAGTVQTMRQVASVSSAKHKQRCTTNHLCMEWEGHALWLATRTSTWAFTAARGPEASAFEARQYQLHLWLPHGRHWVARHTPTVAVCPLAIAHRHFSLSLSRNGPLVVLLSSPRFNSSSNTSLPKTDVTAAH